jgi:Raf kinase inhibitor-like YbhB/YbcL family protein
MKMWMSFRVRSTAFGEGQRIPKRHTGDGLDLSPPLEWSGAPPATRAFALLATDPDAPRGTWTHWVLYDLAADTNALAEEMPRAHLVAGGARQGRNSWKKIGWNGPRPPPGAAHRYVFTLYALDRPLGLAPAAAREDVELAMRGHILAEASTTGRYSR